MTKTVFLFAGEASADLLGADLMRAMQKKHKNLKFIGVGGVAMHKAGLESLCPLDDFAVMGFSGVLPRIPFFLKRLKELTAAAQAANIDALVTIDNQDFSKRLARRIKAATGKPAIHYVVPKVWAWRPQRAAKYAAIYDHLLALFPFEPPYFEEYGVPCTFVGHPVAQRLKAYTPPPAPPPLRLALLPGSRPGEIERHWPVMRQVFEQLKQSHPDLTAVVPLAQDVTLPDVPAGVDVVVGEARFQALQACRAALAKSGTANLELAMLGVPSIVVFQTSTLNAWLVRRLVDIPYVSPVNWVAGTQVLPELLQDNFTPEKALAHLQPLLTDDQAWQTQAQALATVRATLTVPDAAARAADIVARYL